MRPHACQLGLHLWYGGIQHLRSSAKSNSFNISAGYCLEQRGFVTTLESTPAVAYVMIKSTKKRKLGYRWLKYIEYPMKSNQI